MLSKRSQIEKILTPYLAGGVLKNWNCSKDFFESQDELLESGYEMVGSTCDHSIIENYYSVSEKKGINFKIYLYENVPWSSGVDFFGFRLKFVLKAARCQIRNIDIFFDTNTFDDGALILNGFCVCRFSFMGEKSPRALTFETDVSASTSMRDSRVSTVAVFRQFKHIKEIGKYKNIRRVRKIFEMVAELAKTDEK